jgi:hypothetical protein
MSVARVTAVPTLRQRCSNDNHGRAIVTVRFCSTCGVLLNQRVHGGPCDESSHAQLRRSMSRFCLHCGESLERHRDGVRR